MPRLKQPSPLEEQAFEILLDHVLNEINKISVAGEVDLLKQNVVALKKHLRENLAPILLLKFCRDFLSGLTEVAWRRGDNPQRSDHDCIVFKILLDLEIIGLKFPEQLVRVEDCYMDGLLRWQMLTLTADGIPNLTDFEESRLRNLTEMEIYYACDDDNLKIIGSHCAKLKVLKIKFSDNVTDEGRRALSSCTELRVITFFYFLLNNSTINKTLSIHKKLEAFNIIYEDSDSDEEEEESFDVLTRERTLVCPSLKKFSIKLKGSTPLTHEHLSAVVQLFPNLSDFEIASDFTDDILHILKGLKKLNGLVFKYPVRYNDLEKFLMEIGKNITKLSIISPSPQFTQIDLELVYKHCSNIEFLEFKSISYEEWQEEDKLVIPPFRKLKHLYCRGPLTDTITDNILALEITELPAIETLEGRRMSSRGAVQMVESMMFDHIKFPNLKLVRTDCLLEKDVIRKNELAKNNNLNFNFSNSYVLHLS